MWCLIRVYSIGIEYNSLSYDVAVIQWLTPCHKNRMTTRYITHGYWRLMPWCRPWQHYVFFWNNVSFKSIKLYLNSHMINRILHLWSFHMKFMKLAQGLFHKFHMKWPLYVINKHFSYQDTPPLCSFLVCILNFDNKTSNHIWLTIWPLVNEQKKKKN